MQKNGDTWLLTNRLQFFSFNSPASEIEKLLTATPLPDGLVFETLQGEPDDLVWAIAIIRDYLARPVILAGLYPDPGLRPLQGLQRPTYATISILNT